MKKERRKEEEQEGGKKEERKEGRVEERAGRRQRERVMKKKNRRRRRKKLRTYCCCLKAACLMFVPRPLVSIWLRLGTASEELGNPKRTVVFKVQKFHVTDHAKPPHISLFSMCPSAEEMRSQVLEGPFLILTQGILPI